MKFLLTFLAVIPFMALAQPAPAPAKVAIIGNFADLPDSVYIAFYHPTASDPVATGYSKNKKFEIGGDVSFAGASRLSFSGKGVTGSLDLFAGPGKITVTGTVKNLAKVQITGAPHQKTFLQFVKVFEPQFKKLNDINAQLQTAADAAQRDKLAKSFEAVKTAAGGKVDSFVRRNTASPVSAFLVFVSKDLFADQPVMVQNLLSMLGGEALTSVYAEVTQKSIAASLFGSAGSAAPDFTQADTSGKPVSLSQFKGKYVLLDFWASWCGPCRMENPNVVQAYQKFKNKNFTILGVSLDRPGKKADWLAAIADDNLTWTHVSDLQFWSNAVAQQYKVGSIPQNYLIDPQGKIVAKNLRGPALDEKLCELLGCGK
jgi:peroxiredoxin